MPNTIAITGGGTGGHVFPALAIAQELKQRGFSVLYIGSPNGMEAKLVPQKGLPFFTVTSGAVKNQSPLKILSTIGKLFLGILQAWKILGKEKPRAVIGVGGYVSVPVCLATVLRRIPLFLQEQNASVGIANKVLAPFSRNIFLGFDKAKEELPKNKCVLTGNPLRKEISHPDFPAHDPSAHRLLIMGGSQGAHAINQVICECLPEIARAFPGLSILHQTGAKDLNEVSASYAKNYPGKFEVVPFIQDMATAYSQPSLIIARSGALTVSELIAVGRPALFIPFPRKGKNDQTTNAYLLESHGAAKVVEQGSQFRERFWSAFQSVFSPPTLSKMAASYSGLRTPGALVSIGDLIEAALGAQVVQENQ